MTLKLFSDINLLSLEAINFYQLHLSLLREYLDLEFDDIEPILPFDYSLERVIDDFILPAVFVGDAFVHNLPDLTCPKECTIVAVRCIQDFAFVR